MAEEGYTLRITTDELQDDGAITTLVVNDKTYICTPKKEEPARQSYWALSFLIDDTDDRIETYGRRKLAFEMVFLDVWGSRDCIQATAAEQNGVFRYDLLIERSVNDPEEEELTTWLHHAQHCHLIDAYRIV